MTMNHLFILLLVLLSWASAEGNTYIHKDLDPPASDKITAYSNGPLPGAGTRTDVSRKEFLKILREGSVLGVAEYGDRVNEHRRNHYWSWALQCAGVAVDADGVVYFWELTSARTISLQVAEGAWCYLEFDFDLTEVEKILKVEKMLAR
jgi:hypothetical protein